MTDTPSSQENITLVDLIDRLILPPEPQAVSMVPQTPGWAVAAGTIAVLLTVAGLRYFKRRRANRYRRVGISQLGLAQGDPVRIAEILRRTALVAYPRSRVASLHGLQWLRFLDKTSAGSEFSEGIGQLITTAPYLKRGSTADEDLTLLAKKWIETHKAQVER